MLTAARAALAARCRGSDKRGPRPCARCDGASVAPQGAVDRRVYDTSVPATAAPSTWRQPAPPALGLLVVACAVLYLGRELLVPLAVAILFSFLLAPAVQRLERWRFGTIPSVIVVVVCAFAVVGAIAWVAGTQVVSLAASLPEYRDNIRHKVQAVRGRPGEGTLNKAAEAIKDLGDDVKEAVSAADQAPRRPGRQPTPVVVQDAPPEPLQVIAGVLSPLIAPLGMAAGVIVFTVLMLLQRQDLRDRVIRLGGRTRIQLTTQALEEAAFRVSRYLRMQLLVNVSYGVPVGVGLYFIGVPNALLWGLLSAVLRFVPYAGAWIAASFPLALAFAIGPDWSLLLWTAALFVTLELVSNNVLEPWLYGSSTGLSAFAVIASAVFWTLLWGPIGLLLATPLTACVLVIGRHIPQLSFLTILLGDEPVLEPAERFYQRLLARDEAEASEYAEQYLEANSLGHLYEQVFMPALSLAEQDRHRDALDAERASFVFEAMLRIVDMLAERPVERAADPVADDATRARLPRRVVILPAHDQADAIAGTLLAKLLEERRFEVVVLPDALVGEMVERAAESPDAVVCISAMPPAAALRASYLCKRVRARSPSSQVVVALWNASGDVDKARVRLEAAGAHRIALTLDDTVDAIEVLAQHASLQPSEPELTAR